MECQNEFCLYQENGKCKLNRIRIDEFGICSDCILVNIPEEKLTELKQKELAKLEESSIN